MTSIVAPMTSILAPVSERRRVREVRKYGTNVAATISGTLPSISSPDTTLTALMQLIAWKLGMQRAMVSVVDENAQYFLAESTRSLNLRDSSQHDAGDGLWMGCGGTIHSEALCANTIEVQPEPGSHAIFSVSDLSQDARFSQLSYVAGSPNFRYYAGTPLLARSGIAIGTVFVIDDRPRGPLTAEEIGFLGNMAHNVMEYLEMRRENEMRARVDIMTKGLAALVEGKSEIPYLWNDIFDVNDEDFDQLTAETVLQTNKAASSEVSKELPKVKNSVVKSDDSSSSGTSFLKATPNPKVEEEDDPRHEQLFSRAANILRETLDVSYTVFFDVRVGNSTPVEAIIAGATPVHDEIIANHQEPHWPATAAPNTPPIDIIGEIPSPEQQWGDATATAATAAGRQASRLNLANVLTFSTKSAPFTTADDLESAASIFYAPEQRRLRRLLKRHPAGKLWSFNELGTDFVNEGGQLNGGENPPIGSPEDQLVKTKEAELLMSCFPGVQQVLFAPLWEAGKASHIAACFAVSLRPEPVFTTETETAYIRAFMNSISVACGLASTKAANRQKGDFISSISHELRSPLHGIIASVELLAGSALDKHQKEFCDTIATCGQVLLDTISDILEYTKINSLRKDARGLARLSRNASMELLPGVSINEESTLLRMMAEEPTALISDVAQLCEDAVGVVAAAHVLATLTSEQHLHRVYLLPGATTIVNGQVTSSRKGSVPVILDISQADWGFVCLSGAFQRIVMNLVGNSLKYTQSGFIQIHLSMQAVEDSIDDGYQQDRTKRMIVLKIRDSGKGISSDFLKNKLFSAFSQESVLAPGTGLGLHIVKNLVQMHDGTVHVKSQVGKGTSVTVTLPLLKPDYRSSPAVSKHTMAISKSGKLSTYVSAVRNSLKTGRYAIHGFTSSTASLTKDSLIRYLTQWLEMSRVDDTTEGTTAEIVIVDEEGFSNYISIIDRATSVSQPRLIVVCDPTRQPQLFQHISTSTVNVEILTTPFGPNKLSRVILASLEITPTASVSPTITNPIITEAISPPIVPLPFLPEPKVLKAPIPPKLPLPLSIRPALQPKNPLRILCVDDNPINLRLLKTYLEKLNYTDITCATNGSTTFDAVRHCLAGFQLIFMDLSMPVLDGFDSTGLIRGLEKLQARFPIPSPAPSPALIVALTGLAAQEDQDRAREAGADHFITNHWDWQD